MFKKFTPYMHRALWLAIAVGCYGTAAQAQTIRADTAIASNDDRVPVPARVAQATEEGDTSEDRWSAHAQSTYVWQHKNAFSAPYSGPQSLGTRPEHSYTFTFTAYLGARFWKGGELYVNPEAVQGLPLSGLFGLASIQNGEIQKNGGTTLRGYYARAFLRQTFNLGGETFHVEAGPNQLASNYQRQRLVFTVGKITQTDIFEKSNYANDPRTQFLNWALITHGAWDYAADARAYTIGAAAEFYWDDWAVRVGRFMEPKVANGPKLNYQIGRFHGDQFELEHDHKIGDLPGLVRVMVFRNRAFAGNYRDAINAAQVNGGVPDVTSVRKDANKTGYGLSVEQRITDDIGVFARASYADDKVEEYAFTEIDKTVSGGISIKGIRWQRPDDTIGIAFSSAGLNRDHRDYLAAGGLGGFLGDGQLSRYGREKALEIYYNFQIAKGVQFTADFQRITNPGYNADRQGPIQIIGGRFHVEI
ncbi:carbohydrate porin [Dyella tabacisoli]|uniref:Carbohydrate porin n=1 Tax=Dyella tabacisoli TaxID=2282381 RepID=A0A369ULZ2_9GAMM|nr:carbohydrate porin [Dyella tabacisoli]RDD80728.1 carbohydrate porin [Dyella tabacisoli]